MKWSMPVTLHNYCESTTPVRLSDSGEAVRFVSFEVCGERDVGTDTSEVSSRVGPISNVYDESKLGLRNFFLKIATVSSTEPLQQKLSWQQRQPIHAVHCSSRLE